MDLVMTFVTFAVGVTATWFFSRLYYKQAGQELKEEATRLRTLTTLMLRGLEEAGLADYNRNSSGEIIGMEFKRTVSATASGIPSIGIKVIRKVDQQSAASQ